MDYCTRVFIVVMMLYSDEIKCWRQTFDVREKQQQGDEEN